FPPGEVLHLVREDNPRDGGVVLDRYFPGITLHLVGDGTDHDQPDRPVVLSGRQNDCWAATRLLVAPLRVEIQPDHVASPRDVAALAHSASLPTGGPVSMAAWMFSRVTPAISPLNV